MNFDDTAFAHMLKWTIQCLVSFPGKLNLNRVQLVKFLHSDSSRPIFKGDVVRRLLTYSKTLKHFIVTEPTYTDVIILMCFRCYSIRQGINALICRLASWQCSLTAVRN